MNDNLNKLITKKDKLLKQLEIVYEQIALERILLDQSISITKKEMDFESKVRNKFRIK